MNKLFLCGRLTRDPEVRTATNNMTVASFSIAVDRRFKKDGEPEADFFNCTAFGKTAEIIEKYCKKATKLIIEGRLQNDNYEKDGVKHYAVKVIVESIEFAESKAAAAKNDPGVKPADSGDGFLNISSELTDELPFN